MSPPRNIHPCQSDTYKKIQRMKRGLFNGFLLRNLKSFRNKIPRITPSNMMSMSLLPKGYCIMR